MHFICIILVPYVEQDLIEGKAAMQIITTTESIIYTTYTVSEVKVDLVSKVGLLSLLAQHSFLPSCVLGLIQSLIYIGSNTQITTVRCLAYW